MATIAILNGDYCTGCGACNNICPVGAIEMKPNEEGFLHPCINKSKCIDCGLCAKSCPQLVDSLKKNQPKSSYAVWARKELRESASSGGVFPAIAEYVISKKGVVFGASFDDGCRNLRFTKATCKKELVSLYKSKYVQADTGFVFKEIKELLDKNTYVAFCGCPCQVDGLKVFLKKDYDNLLTMDLLCHGAPSPMAYNKFLDEHSNNGQKKIKNVDFRNKKYGWGTLIRIDYEDGSTPYYCEWNQDYFIAFLRQGFNKRKSCFDCSYSQPKRVGDITLGDFWGVKNILPEYDDNKGTSLVLCNTCKGQDIFEKIKLDFEKYQSVKYKEMFDISAKFNGAMTPQLTEPTSRKRFFKRLKIDTFSNAVSYASQAKMDVGIVGWWIETVRSNYGSTLTDYALYKFFESQGFSTAMISPPNFDRNFAGDFNKRYGYRMTTKYTSEMMVENNKYFDAFVVASDALWYYDAMIENGFMFLLDFVDDTKKKISYATSFGNSISFFPDSKKPYAKYLLKKFDHIGVREFEGVDLCKNVFGVEATQVLDPVFICDTKYYDLLENNATRRTEGDYIFAYILDPTPEKVEGLENFGNRMGIKIVSITDKQFQTAEKENLLKKCGIISGATIEEFIWHIKNSKFVVTDSFHGFCFACIFNVPFAVLVNRNRGSSRFDTLSTIFEVQNRMFESMNEVNSLSVEQIKAMDMTKLNENMIRESERSKNWLLNAITSNKTQR